MLKCPACSNGLSKLIENGVELDACVGGCGGIWFDNQELQKVEQGVRLSWDVVRVQKNEAVVVDRSRERLCPRCPSQVLSVHYFDADPSLELDECMRCGGVWLDLGELAAIKSLDDAVHNRNLVFETYAKKVSSGQTSAKGARAVMELLFK